MQERSLHFILLLFVAEFKFEQRKKKFFPSFLARESDYTVVGYATNKDFFSVIRGVWKSFKNEDFLNDDDE